MKLKVIGYHSASNELVLLPDGSDLRFIMKDLLVCIIRQGKATEYLI